MKVLFGSFLELNKRTILRSVKRRQKGPPMSTEIVILEETSKYYLDSLLRVRQSASDSLQHKHR